MFIFSFSCIIPVYIYCIIKIIKKIIEDNYRSDPFFFIKSKITIKLDNILQFFHIF